MDDPQTDEQWQEAADAADFLLLIDSARQYGLITGGPIVNVPRCIDILEGAAELGIFPSPPDRRRFWVARWLRNQLRDLGVPQVAVARYAGLSQVAVSLIVRERRSVDRAQWDRIQQAIEAIRKEHGS
jgi:hypothetical protein